MCQGEFQTVPGEGRGCCFTMGKPITQKQQRMDPSRSRVCATVPTGTTTTKTKVVVHRNPEKKMGFKSVVRKPMQPVAQQVDFQQYFCFVLFFCFGSSLKTGYYFSTVDSMLMLYNNTNSMTQHNKEKKDGFQKYF